MNRSYRVVWNAVLNVWQAASELTKGQGKGKSRSARRVVALGAGALALTGAQAGTLPTGGQIVGGVGSIGQAGKAMTVQQGSDKLAIDWQSFSIGKDNLVRFVQPGSDSIALNRVLGQDVSVIQGALQANGKIFLVNPNGILFTPGAQVDVGGILASTLKISKEDFLAGKYTFGGDSQASVVNQGSIRTADGGLVALIAARVINEGDISAPKGDVLLGAGSKVRLDLGGPVTLEVEQGALDALIQNGGAIRADAGNILLTARAAEQLAGTVINTTGLIEAKSLEVGQDGSVTLSAGGGGVNVAGVIDVSSNQAKGGKVVVTGTEVNVASGARIDATGATGGGEIYVGGGWQGKDPAIAQAVSTRIAGGAVLDASATVSGNGGTVVAWSDTKNAVSVTQVDGTLRARGGAQGGHGGRIETSGASLGVSQAADASAANGKGGVWLLDPDEVTVASTGGAIGNATVSHSAINTALGGGTNVDIQAVNKIDWQEDLQATVNASGAKLTLKVDNNADVENFDTGIFLNGGIDARGAGNGKLDIVLDGNVRLGQGKDIGIHSNGGDVLFGAYVDSASADKALAGKLRITAVDGTVTFSDMVGGTNALDALYVTTTTNGKTYINGAIVRTHNEQVYESPVELGTVQFVNPDFEDGTNGWTIVDGRFVTGTTQVDGWTSPKDTTYPTNNNSNGNNGDDRTSSTGSYSHEIVAGQEGQGDALKLTVSGNCGGSGGGSGYCVVRGPYVVSDSTIALAKGDKVTFDWTAQAGAGQDAYDVFGYLLNVKTGEAQIILNRTGDSATGGSPWGTATVTADKAGTYKFVFVSGTYDFTGGNVIGANLTIDNVAASGGPKGLQGSSITFGKGLNATDNNLTVKADEIDLNGPVVGTGKLAFETLTPTTNIEVGGARTDGGDSTSDGKLKLSNEDIAALGDGFQSVRIGDSNMKGNISIVEDSRFNDDLIINAGTGNIAINGGLTVKDIPGTGNDDGHNPVIVLESKGGNVTQDQNGVLDAGGLVLLGDGATHDLDNADNRIGTIASNTGSVSYGVAPGQTLTVGTVTTQTGETHTGMVNEKDTSLTADEIDIAATIATEQGGTLTLKQKTPGLDIHLGGTDQEIVADGDPLRLSQADLDNVRDGFGKIAIGDGNTRNITVDNAGATLKDDVALTAGGKLDLQGNLSLVDPQGKDEDDTIGNGLVLTVDAKQGATQADGAIIRADELALRGNGDFDLGRGAHDVSVIAADVGGLKFTSGSNLTVGTVDGTTGITSEEAVALRGGGALDIQQGITITAGAAEGGHDTGTHHDGDRTNDTITLEAAGPVTQGVDGKLDAHGLALLGGDGVNYALDQANNRIDVIASDAGKVNFNNSGNAAVGTLAGKKADGTDYAVVGVDNNGDVSIKTDGNLSIGEQLVSTGNVFLNVGGKTTQDTQGVIKAGGLGLTGGDYALNNGGNVVGDIASDAGKVSFANSGDVKVGKLTETDGNGNVVRTITGVNNTGDVSINTGGNLTIDEQLVTTGNVFLNVGGKTTQDAEGLIKAGGLTVVGGEFILNNGGNIVRDIASNAGKVSFANNGDLKVGKLTETDGDGNVVRTIAGVNNTGDVSINTNGNLTIDEQLATTGNVFLSVGGKTTQDAEGVIKAGGLGLTGGDYALNNGGNIVGDIASDAGKVSFANNGDLKVGKLTETDGNGNVVRTVTGVDNTGDVSINTNGNLTIGEQLATTGNVFLNIGGKTTQDAEGVIKAGGLALSGGDYALNNGGNIVGDIASNAGKVSFTDSGDVKVGKLTETDGNGNVVRTVTGVNNNGDVSINTNGNLTIDEQLASTGNVFLNIGGKTMQDAEGVIKAGGLGLTGGDYALNNGGNIVGDIASDAGKVSFANGGDLKVGKLTETDGDGNVVRTITGVNNTGDVSINTNGNLTIDEQLASTGNVFLNIGGKTTQDAEGVIKAGGLALSGGDYALNNGGNIVGDIASNAGKVSFTNSGDVKVGKLTETDGNGNVVRTITGVNNTGDVSINTNGNLTIDEQLASAGNVFLNVGGKTTQDVEGVIKAGGLALSGGDYALNNGGNVVGDIASDAGKVSFTNSGDVKVGKLSEIDGDGNVVRTITGVNNTGDVSIKTTGNLAIGEQLASTANVFLDVAGKTTQDAAKGGIRAAGLALKGGDFDLDDGSNLVGQIASRADDVTFAGQGDLTIGTLTEYALSDGAQLDQIVGIANTGKVRVTTPNGDITVKQNVGTTSNATDAIVLNAGAAHSAGDASGGDVIVDAGRTIQAGAGGRAVIYTGSLAGSTGVVDAVGSGSGNFRYNGSESESNFGRPLGATGTHAVYREQPRIVVSTNGQTTTQKLYDGKPVFDGGGMAGFDVSGLVNGDLKAMLGNPAYAVAGTAPGTYPIQISLLNELGYAVQNDPNNAMLTVRPAQAYDGAIGSIGGMTGDGVSQGEAHGGLAGGKRDDYGIKDWASFAVMGLNLVQADPQRQAGGLAGAGVIDRTGSANDGTRDGDTVDGRAGRPDCVSGQAGACSEYGPQPVFVVKGGVRLPQ